MSVVEQVAASRKRRGITAAQVAERAGLQTSNLYAIEQGRRRPTIDTLERAAAGLGLRIIAVDVGNQALVSDIADAIAGYEAVGLEELAYRVFLQLNNQLFASSASTQVILTYVPPCSISVEWDASIAALVEWRLGQKNAPIPRWVGETAGLEAGHWAPWPSIRVVDANRELVPTPFLRRGIWIESGELESM